MVQNSSNFLLFINDDKFYSTSLISVHSFSKIKKNVCDFSSDDKHLFSVNRLKKKKNFLNLRYNSTFYVFSAAASTRGRG